MNVIGYSKIYIGTETGERVRRRIRELGLKLDTMRNAASQPVRERERKGRERDRMMSRVLF